MSDIQMSMLFAGLICSGFGISMLVIVWGTT